MFRVEVAVDFVCPWCFIGLHRLRAAVDGVKRQIPDFACEIRFRPFFLNPDTPVPGEPYLPFLEHKFGSRAAVERLFNHVREAGAAYGVDFAFEKISLRANTLLAHRLVHWAQDRGDALALVERLFAAQFQRGKAIGDADTLARIAGECAYPAEAAASFLASGEAVREVIDDEQDIRSLGIRQVPTFILPGGELVIGAENPAVLSRAILEKLAP